MSGSIDWTVQRLLHRHALPVAETAVSALETRPPRPVPDRIPLAPSRRCVDRERQKQFKRLPREAQSSH
jgi:hypothetical protein